MSDLAFSLAAPALMCQPAQATCAHPPRRQVLRRAIAAAAVAAALLTSPTPSECEVLSAPVCVKGEGSGCEANASESPLVRKLLEKSRANRERNDQETLEKYWKQGYGDYFAYGNKKLVKNRDGTWALEEPDDLILEIGKRIAAMAKGDDNKK